MASLTAQQKQAINNALDILQGMIDCYRNISQENQKVPPERIRDIQDMVNGLKNMNNSDLIDWESSSSIGRTARTDGSGIHLNDKFGNDYRNDYELPDDYKIDDCENGYFYSLWRIFEILIHEQYHYENHTGLFGTANKVVAIFAYGIFGSLTEGLSSVFSEGPVARRTHFFGHEHQAYFWTEHLLGWIDSMIFWICMEEDQACIECCEQHQQRIEQVRENQKAYELK